MKNLDITDFVLSGQGAAIVKLQTTRGTGADDVWVDGTVVPPGIVRYIQNVTVTPDSVDTAGVNITAFVCDSATMNPNQPPLQNGGRVNYDMTGAIVGASAASTFQSEELIFPGILLSPGEFARFVTITDGAVPNAGDFFNLSILQSDFQICQ